MARYSRIPRSSDPLLVRVGQVVPAEFADQLRQMRTIRDPHLSGVLRACVEVGWTAAALGVAVGLTREAVLVRARDASSNGRIEVPDPPRREPPPPKPPKRELDPDVVAQLQRMQAVAGTVNGAMPEDDPRRAASVEYARLLADLNAQGFGYGTLAKAVGVHTSSIRFRLGRHGYRTLPPSQAPSTYMGRRSVGGGANKSKTHCPAGHPYDEANTYVTRRGYRQCRTCHRDYSLARYHARRAVLKAVS